jgi:hypothetical protein
VLTGDLSGTHLIRSAARTTWPTLANWYLRTTTGTTDRLGLPEQQARPMHPAHAATSRILARRSASSRSAAGIAGDFPICVVPMIHQDLGARVPLLGLLLPDQRLDHQLRLVLRRVPNEKITWGKLDVETPRFMIESDATIVAPLIFARILGW